MADLRGLTTDAKRLYEALDFLVEQQETVNDNDIDFKEIWFTAKNRPFTLHILSRKEETVARMYLKILASLVALTTSTEKRTIQIRFIARILASCTNVDVSIKDIITDGIMLSEESISEFQGITEEDVQQCLLVDLLLLCYLDGQPDDAQLNFVAGFMAVLGTKEENVKAIGNVVRGILEQNDSFVFEQGKYFEVSNVYCYLKEIPDSLVMFDLEKAKTVDAEKVILKGVEFKSNSTIDCSKFKASIIEFTNCTFSKVQGLINKSEDKKIIIKNCTFKDSEVEQTYMVLRNATISNSTFKNIRTFNSINSPLIVLDKCEVSECTFEGIKLSSNQDLYGGRFLEMFKTTFGNCKISGLETEFKYTTSNTAYYRRIIGLYGGRMFECEFNDFKLSNSSILVSFNNDITTYSDIQINNISCSNYYVGINENLSYGTQQKKLYEEIFKA